jgi:threonine/homoserine/homoserine lactone efflux protein
MPDLETIIAVTLAGFALSLTPGPSMLYVLSRSVGQSRAAGLASALGLGVGGVLLAVATALGLAALFERLDWLVTVLRYAGSGYLVWLGLDMIRKAQEDARRVLVATRVTTADPFMGIFWQGVVIELLNPKTVLFFALFLPPFVNAGGDQGLAMGVQAQLLMLGALVPLTALPSDLVVAFCGGTFAKLVNQQHVVRRYLASACGLMLIAIAISLHL